MKKRIPAEVFAPGEYISEEMEFRGWDVQGLAAIMRVDVTDLQAVLEGKAPILVGLAESLGKAFGTSWKFWYNLEKAYRAKGAK